MSLQEHTELLAVWHRPNFTVTFMLNGGTGTAPGGESRLKGETIQVPVPGGLSRDGYRFVGWNTRADGAGQLHLAGSQLVVTGFKALHATWQPVSTDGQGDIVEPNNVAILLAPNGGDPLMNIPLASVPAGTVITLPAAGFTRPGYDFVGWRTAGGTAVHSGNSPFTVPASDVTLQAEWVRSPVVGGASRPAARVFTVTLHPNGGQGSAIELMPVPFGTTIMIPGAGFVRQDHALNGWNTQANGAGTGYASGTTLRVTGNIVLHAVWGPAAVTGITITGGPPSVERGDTEPQPFTAKVAGTGQMSQNVRWEVVGAIYGSRGTIITTPAGILTVGIDEVAGADPFDLDSPGYGTLTIRAVSIANPAIYADRQVRITGSRQAGDWRYIGVGVDHTLAISWDGHLYTWGAPGTAAANRLGRTSTGADGANPQNRPRRVGEHDDWLQVSGGQGHSVGLRGTRNPDGTVTNGTIWRWGNIISNVAVPTQIGTDNDWRFVATGDNTIFAIRNDGRLYGLGGNANGRLGIGNTTAQNVLVRVGAPTLANAANHLPPVVFVASGRNHTVALTEDGRLWGWGANNSGQLTGGQTATGPNAPVSITPTRRWRSVAVGGESNSTLGFTVGIDHYTGHMYTWGTNGDHALARATGGRNDPPANTPNRITVPAGHPGTWESVNLTITRHVLAVASDRSLWAWGFNARGQVGNGSGDIGNSTRTQNGLFRVTVPNTSNRWMNSVAGGSFSFAIQEDGSLWGWGHNLHGMIGDGVELHERQNRRRPVRVHRIPP
ncbi:MAG: InlB B-repeat-containing protein, partial [Treponema sp.]|nr:InlB B-repeat-containing protein [Treponema sp.]